MIRTTNILGTEYSVAKVKTQDMPQKDVWGLCERYSKEIIIDDDAFFAGEDACRNPRLAQNKVLRHELIHAYLHEAGLSEYAEDEMLVEALAILIPKIYKTFTEMECEE